MKELFEQIDELLSRLEDFTHGQDGEEITRLRGKIAKAQQSELEKEELVKGLLVDLMNNQEEVLNSPIRFNGVHVEKIKHVFEQRGIKYDVGF